MFYKKRSICAIIVMLMVLLTGCVSGQDNGTNHPEENPDQGDSVPELTEQRVLEIENRFFDLLFTPDSDINTNEIKNYKSKQALVEDVSEIASLELAAAFVEEYFYEEDDKLYIVATESPAKILSDSSYELKQVDDTTAVIVQEEENVMRGAYRLTVEFSFQDDKWIMTDREMELIPYI